MDVPRSAEPLLALPPSRFKAERDALARELAARGDPAAAAVRRIPRPVGLAWVLNRLARERPREIEALLTAGDQLRAGQRRAVSGAGANELRAADDDLRARARALRAEAERILAAEGRPAAAPTLARLELLLRVTAPLPGPARDALARGVLLREPDIASGELSGLELLAGGRAPRAGPDRPPPSPPRETPRQAKRRREQARAAEVREARERRARERRAARARREVKAANALAAREERAAAAAAERSRRAAERAARARAEAERLAARLRDLERPS